MPVQRISKTALDVVTAVKRQFGDTSGVQVNDAHIIAWINDAQREIVINNPELKPAIVSVNVTAGQATYPLLSNVPDMLIVHSIHYKGQILKGMTFVEAQEYLIRENSVDANFNSGTPWFWYEYAGTVTLYPVPDLTTTGGLTIYYSQSPTEVTSVNNNLALTDAYFTSIVDYCMWQAYEMDDNFQAAQVKSQHFNESVNKRSNRERSNDNVYPTITLLPEDNIY